MSKAISKKRVFLCLKKVIDPELMVDIVSLGLIYEVVVADTSKKNQPRIKIIMTLTSPGCPLAGSFDMMVRESLADLPDLDVYKDVEIELTFDPPWTADMISEEAKAELGFD